MEMTDRNRVAAAIRVRPETTRKFDTHLMHFLDFIAERKIAAAEAAGELRDLPGAGAPLDLDDDPLIPEDLRMAYRILKNAGLVPEEVTMLREIGQLEGLVRDAEARGDAPDAQAMRRLQLLGMKLDAAAPGRASLLLGDRYRQRVLERMAGIDSEDAERT
jgi:hypothetical protein